MALIKKQDGSRNVHAVTQFLPLHLIQYVYVCVWIIKAPLTRIEFPITKTMSHHFPACISFVSFQQAVNCHLKQTREPLKVITSKCCYFRQCPQIINKSIKLLISVLMSYTWYLKLTNKVIIDTLYINVCIKSYAY